MEKDSIPAALREDVNLLGTILGEAIRKYEGEEVFEKVERIRALSKKARSGDNVAFRQLSEILDHLSLEEARSITRAFAQFLNLANIAEQHHRVRRRRYYQRQNLAPQKGSIEEALCRLVGQGVSPEELYSTVCDLQIGLVLTAHPTEIVRRTLLQKYNNIAALLKERDRPDLTTIERQDLAEGVKREICAAWLTDEIRRTQPTPLDETEAGLLVFEQTLWNSVPAFLRQLDRTLQEVTGKSLPLQVAPVRFGSWMGGDRDGNPNVTADITKRACLLSRWIAADLYYREFDELRNELSLVVCNEELRSRVGLSAREPYREFLRTFRDRLLETREYLGQLIVEARADRETSRAGAPRHYLEEIQAKGLLCRASELLEPLLLCERSLREIGADAIAHGRILDLIRRLSCFGLTLVKVDLRQDSRRHAEVIDHVTTTLGLGSYLSWSEEQRQQFLLAWLERDERLVPENFPYPEDLKEIPATFAMISELCEESLGKYVISMAKAPSDILLVEFFQKQAGVDRSLQAVPLFETGEDLRNARETMERLLSLPWYRKRLAERYQDHQEVMLGYSDSAKDIGRLSANWELYQAQEKLVSLFQQKGVRLTLFHGRGGSVGRGGGPTYLAMLSQPPGSIRGSIRVTEQGEMIQAKFGIPEIAERTLEVYLTSTLEATLRPPALPRPEWRGLMDEFAEVAKRTYQSYVKEDPRFVDYFRCATPEEELSELKIGSRPTRRSYGQKRGIESLRAIPWVFAWTQNRLLLPGWLGFGRAMEHEILRQAIGDLRQMYRQWPFFQACMELIEMVLAKADAGIAARYDERLVPSELQSLGKEFRDRLRVATQLLLQITERKVLLEGNPVLRRAIDVRNPYIDPINLMQVAMLHRLRTCEELCDPLLRETLLVTFNGIAAGMRNTG